MPLRVVTLFGIVASIVTGIALGILGYRHWFESAEPEMRAGVIEQAARHIRSQYVEEVPREQLVRDALKGMLDGLDEHSKYLDRDAYKRLRAEPADGSDDTEGENLHARWLEPGYAHVRITRFRKDTGKAFAEAVGALRRSGTGESGDADQGGLAGLILDLRDNLGGVLGGSVDTADVLLDQGLLICTESRPGGRRLDHLALTPDLLDGAPAVVLINKASASGAEIVASALQDHGRALVIGAKSFGKGSVQSVLPLAGRRALKLTTGHYFRPNGGPIHATGVVPDVPVVAPDSEAWLDRALQIVKQEAIAGR